MRVLIINETCGTGSHGKICVELAEKYRAEGNECFIAYGRHECTNDEYKKFSVRIGDDSDVKLHAIQTRLFDAHGFGSKKATEKFLDWVMKYNPDLILLHNLHGYYINVEELFLWIKQHPHVRIKWTLHDCWAFTGHCSHFMITGCEKWKSGCGKCPEKGHYPATLLLDNSRSNYKRKKELFSGVPNLEISVPSMWLFDKVKQSFLSQYPIILEYNKVDVSAFSYTDNTFKTDHNIQQKKMLLGVAVDWIPEKGILDVVHLSRLLDSTYCIVLVGITEKDLLKYQRKEIFRSFSTENIHPLVYESKSGVAVYPNVESMFSYITEKRDLLYPIEHAEIICIPRTNDKAELAKIYSAADYFINPTHEDNYPTVNLEAKACGTFVITYDTGGAKETIGWRDNL